MKDTQGWISLHRKSLDSSVWKSPTVWFVWSWCLLKASHATNTFAFNGTDMEIMPGQFITGINKAVDELPGLTRQKYRTAIKYLENTKRLTLKSTNQFTLITVNKWQEYQESNTPTNKRITNEQQTDNKRITTNNNDNNDNNVNNDNKRERETQQVATPSNEARIFFSDLDKQLEVLNHLTEKGIEEETARREISKFISYWTEPTKSGTRQRWELEKAFEITRRLGTWFSRIKTFNQSNKQIISI